MQIVTFLDRKIIPKTAILFFIRHSSTPIKISVKSTECLPIVPSLTLICLADSRGDRGNHSPRGRKKIIFFYKLSNPNSTYKFIIGGSPLYPRSPRTETSPERYHQRKTSS